MVPQDDDSDNNHDDDHSVQLGCGDQKKPLCASRDRGVGNLMKLFCEVLAVGSAEANFGFASLYLFSTRRHYYIQRHVCVSVLVESLHQLPVPSRKHML